MDELAPRALAAACAYARDAVLITEAEPVDAASGGPRIVYVNEAFTRMTGYTAAEVLGRTPRLLQSPDTDRRVLDEIRVALRHWRPVEVEVLNIRADGSPFWVQMAISPVADETGYYTHWVSVQRETTNRHHAHEVVRRDLREAQGHLASAFDDAPIGMAITTPTGVLLRVNHALSEVLGVAPSALTGGDLFAVTHPDDLARAQAACAALGGGGQDRVQLDCRLRHADGHYLTAQVTTSAVLGETGDLAHLVMHVQDTSERADLQAELTKRALHDELTGLPNRSLFLDRLAQALGRAARGEQPLSVLFCDVDHFKNVNDSLGHAAGDTVLTNVARRLVSLLRPGDTAARFGGDEFAVLCEDTDDVEADRIAQRLQAAVAEPVRYDGDAIRLSVSIGVITSKGDTGGEDPAAALLRDADIAMYQAKADGRGRHVAFHDGMRRAAVARRSIENDLLQALSCGEFALYYQPIIDVSEGAEAATTVLAVEALLRWNHPSRGLLAPSAFLDVAEDSGLLVPIGRWVLETAAAQAQTWIEAGRQLAPYGQAPAARSALGVTWVNVSTRQLSEQLVEQVAEVLHRCRLPTGSLGLELTESVLMHDLPRIRPLLEEIRSLGVHLAVDDFGTGYSSLAYLASLPVDTVKIDQSFTAQLTGPGHGAAVITAVLALAGSMGLDTVVEGVETKEQLNMLLDLGVTAVQGHLFALPTPAAVATPTR